jgi:arsenate reductase (thioredoxin)
MIRRWDFGTTVDRLCEEFSGTFSRETIERFLSESTEHLRKAPVQSFVPLLGERFARERLKAYTQAGGSLTKEVPEVLFVCVHNAGRSQMAAALLNRAAEGKVHVRSAGSTPANEIHAGVREAMAEIGVGMSQEFPKPLTDEVVRAANVVITMGCGDACRCIRARSTLGARRSRQQAHRRGPSHPRRDRPASPSAAGGTRPRRRLGKETDEGDRSGPLRLG